MVPLELGPGCRVVLEARAPADDSNVSGVLIADAILYARAVDVDTTDETPLLAVWLQPTETLA
jgi:hypothetical protein